MKNNMILMQMLELEESTNYYWFDADKKIIESLNQVKSSLQLNL